MIQGRAFLAVIVLFVGLVMVAPLRLAALDGEATGDEFAALIERGRQSYVLHCGACHGPEGKGDGAVAEYLTVPLLDLGDIGQRSGGEFPFDEVFEIVDGREVEGHGTRAMPVWGPAFMGLEPEAQKKAIKEKIVEVVYYLKSIQAPLPIVPAKLGAESD